jgi:hypothetical protein
MEGAELQRGGWWLGKKKKKTEAGAGCLTDFKLGWDLVGSDDCSQGDGASDERSESLHSEVLMSWLWGRE